MYLFTPNNKELENFSMSAFHWPLILEQCGTYFAAVFHKTRWFYVSGIDQRMGDSDVGPSILLNDNFDVTDEEAKVLARIARNYAMMQRSLDINGDISLMPAIKVNLIDRIEEFSGWAEKSGGFQIK